MVHVRASETAIVTMEINEKRFDMEIPTFMKVEKLKEKLLETLKVMFPASFLEVFQIKVIYENDMLEDNDTLASRGIWDGAILSVIII